MELAEQAARMHAILREVRAGTEQRETVLLLDSMAELLDALAMETERLRDRQAYLLEEVEAITDILFSDDPEGEDENGGLPDGSPAGEPVPDGDRVPEDGEGKPEREDDDYWDEEDEEGFYTAVCPVCGEMLAFGEDVLEAGGAACPSCGTPIQFREVSE